MSSGIIIDRWNWRSMGGLQKGDLVVDLLDHPIAEVISIDGERRAVTVCGLNPAIEYQLDGGRSAAEFLLDFRGYRFLRRG